MRARSYSGLKIFLSVAKHMSITSSAVTLNMTKGAVSYQIKQLENDLGFKVFERRNGKIFLSAKGEALLLTARQSLSNIDAIVHQLQKPNQAQITVGMTTYFASRWLAPRLMRFTSAHPEISIRIQPTIGNVDLQQAGLDIAVRWGYGQWKETAVEKLFLCPAFATAGESTYQQIDKHGLQKTFASMALLHDDHGSVTWKKWCDRAGLSIPEAERDVIISDPNVRVEAVINNQGMAINDELVNPELNNKQLYRVTSLSMDEYGYFLAFNEASEMNGSVSAFRNWILNEACEPLG